MGFVSHSPLMTPDATPSALDFSSLNALKQGVRAGGNAAQDQQHRLPHPHQLGTIALAEQGLPGRLPQQRRL